MRWCPPGSCARTLTQAGRTGGRGSTEAETSNAPLEEETPPPGPARLGGVVRRESSLCKGPVCGKAARDFFGMFSSDANICIVLTQSLKISSSVQQEKRPQICVLSLGRQIPEPGPGLRVGPLHPHTVPRPGGAPLRAELQQRPGLSAPDASRSAPSPRVMKAKTISRRCQMSPAGKTVPS